MKRRSTAYLAASFLRGVFVAAPAAVDVLHALGFRTTMRREQYLENVESRSDQAPGSRGRATSHVRCKGNRSWFCGSVFSCCRRHRLTTCSLPPFFEIENERKQREKKKAHVLFEAEVGVTAALVGCVLVGVASPFFLLAEAAGSATLVTPAEELEA